MSLGIKNWVSTPLPIENSWSGSASGWGMRSRSDFL